MKERDFTMKERLTMPVPKFFKKVRNIGLLLGAVGGALLSSPVMLPTAVISVAGYLVTVGIVSSAISSVAVRQDR